MFEVVATAHVHAGLSSDTGQIDDHWQDIQQENSHHVKVSDPSLYHS